MKVFVSADLEGISGVVAMDDVMPGKDGYAAACTRMTADVNAAVEGAVAGGAEEIVVFDAHAGGRNLDLERLHPEAQVIRGQPSPAMVAGLDARVDALFLVGYHARRGTAAAIMDHTYTGAFNRVRLNGREAGELALAAAYAGSFGVPTALVTGDDKLAKEVEELLPGTPTVVVKTGMERHAAQCLHPAKAQALIRDAAQQTLGDLGRLTPLVLDTPCTLEVEYPTTASADRAACLPSVSRTADARTVAATLESFPDLVRLLSVLAGLTSRH